MTSSNTLDSISKQFMRAIRSSSSRTDHYDLQHSSDFPKTFQRLFPEIFPTDNCIPYLIFQATELHQEFVILYCRTEQSLSFQSGIFFKNSFLIPYAQAALLYTITQPTQRQVMVGTKNCSFSTLTTQWPLQGPRFICSDFSFFPIETSELFNT